MQGGLGQRLNPDLGELLRTAMQPIYGPPGNPYGLALRGSPHGRRPGQAAAWVRLIFANSPFGDANVLMLINSLRSGEPSVKWHDVPQELIGLGYNPYQYIYVDLQMNGGGIPRDYPAGDPERVAGEVMVGGQAFAGELLSWTGGTDLSVFTLTGPDGVLEGATIGLAPEQVFDILSQLVKLQDHAEVVDQYQQDIENAVSAQRQQQGQLAARGPDPSLRQRAPLYPHRPYTDGRRSSGRGTSLLFAEPGVSPEALAEAIRQATTPSESVLLRGALTVDNESDHYALVISETDDGWLGDHFTLRVPDGLALRVLEADAIECSPEADQANVAHCVMGTEDATLAFTAVPDVGG